MKVLIYVPVLDAVQVDHVTSMLAARAHLQARGHASDLAYHVGDAMIDRARNTMAAKFLAGDADALLMIDSDIILPPHGVTQLLEHRLPVVGYNCRHRVPTESWASVSENHDAPLSKARHLGTGVMMIQRDAFTALINARAVEPYVDADGTPAWGFFLPFVRATPERVYLSEDWAFCARLEALQVGVYIDNTVRPKHIGRSFY